MPDTLIGKKRSEGEQEIVLKLLEHVASEQRVSQAGFASQIGIAKGLANTYFNRCLQKGWIKLRQAPRQRYLYYVTPKGFSEKARLTAEFLTSSYQFYRTARADLASVMTQAATNGHKRLAVIGAGELAEIAAIISEECPVQIIGFIDGESGRQRLARRPVTANLSDLGKADAALLATLQNTREAYEAFRREQPDLPIYVPQQLSAVVGE